MKKLKTMQGIRAIATIGIFLFHSGFVPQGTFPVTLFFMLSGFLMFYSKGGREDYDSFIDWNKRYVWKKLKQFYPLHLITFFIACIVGKVWLNPLKGTIIGAILNLLLINPFVPKYAMVFNGLSWYLAITVFLYVISFYLLKLAKKVARVKLFIAVILCIIVILNLINRFVTSLYLYTNPLYRILDYWLGIMVAKLFSEYEARGFVFKRPNLIEFGIIGVFAIQYVISLLLKPGPGYYSILFTVALFVFAVGQGSVSSFLSVKLFDLIARYSFEFYMIHELSLRLFRKVFAGMTLPYPVQISIIALPSLIVSVIFVLLYTFLKTKAVGKLNNI